MCSCRRADEQASKCAGVQRADVRAVRGSAHLWAASTGLPGLRCASMPFADEVMFSFGPEFAAGGFRALGALVEDAAAVDMEGRKLSLSRDELRQASQAERGQGRSDEGGGREGGSAGHSGGTRGRRAAGSGPQRTRGGGRRTGTRFGGAAVEVARCCREVQRQGGSPRLKHDGERAGASQPERSGSGEAWRLEQRLWAVDAH